MKVGPKIEFKSESPLTSANPAYFHLERKQGCVGMGPADKWDVTSVIRHGRLESGGHGPQWSFEVDTEALLRFADMVNAEVAHARTVGGHPRKESLYDTVFPAAAPGLEVAEELGRVKEKNLQLEAELEKANRSRERLIALRAKEREGAPAPKAVEPLDEDAATVLFVAGVIAALVGVTAPGFVAAGLVDGWGPLNTFFSATTLTCAAVGVAALRFLRNQFRP